MTLGELLTELDTRTGQAFLQGSPAETLTLARANEHADPLIGDIVRRLAADCDSVDCVILRVPSVNTLGPLRLKYMADDAPVEGFRLVERTIQGIDDAFNDEVLRARRQ